MNLKAIIHLMRKDWYLRRKAVIGYLAAAVFGAALAGSTHGTWCSTGLMLVLNSLIGLTFHLPISVVLGEREKKTLAFTMSLPITPLEFTVAKLLACLLLYAIPWGAAWLLLLTTGGPTGGGLIIRGLLPVLLGAGLVFFILIVAVAIVSESLGWMMAVLLGGLFIIGNPVLNLGAQYPAVSRYLCGPGFWTVLTLEGVLAAVIVLTSAYAQNRKTSFV